MKCEVWLRDDDEWYVWHFLVSNTVYTLRILITERAHEVVDGQFDILSLIHNRAGFQHSCNDLLQNNVVNCEPSIHTECVCFKVYPHIRHLQNNKSSFLAYTSSFFVDVHPSDILSTLQRMHFIEIVTLYRSSKITHR